MNQITYKRNPINARRHYDATEAVITLSTSPRDAHTILGRPELGLEIKRSRLNGHTSPPHDRDGSWKYRAQEASQIAATRDGKPWEPWEINYLETAYENGHDALAQALRLGRTYRAVEDKRKRLWKEKDKTLSTQGQYA